MLNGRFRVSGFRVQCKASVVDLPRVEPSVDCLVVFGRIS